MSLASGVFCFGGVFFVPRPGSFPLLTDCQSWLSFDPSTPFGLPANLRFSPAGCQCWQGGGSIWPSKACCFRGNGWTARLTRSRDELQWPHQGSPTLDQFLSSSGSWSCALSAPWPGLTVDVISFVFLQALEDSGAGLAFWDGMPLSFGWDGCSRLSRCSC